MDTASTAAARYSRGAIALHWLIAVLIIVNIALAFVSEEMPKETEAQLMANHKAIGILILALTAVRIGWRLTHKPPPLVDTLKAWEAALSKVIHTVFYFMMLAIPLSGWGMSSSFSKGKGVSMFGLFEVPALPVDYEKSTAGMFHDMHEVLGLLMIALIALHVAGALKHLLIDRDGTVRRMVPWLK